MKKFIKVFSVVIILSIICSTCMFACKKDDNTKKEEKDSLSYTFVTSKQISFGSYPQTIAKNVELSDIKTGEYDESTGYYKYNGKTYAIITATPSVEDATFSNGSSVIAGQEYAFVVEDIIWNIIYSKEDNAFVCMSNKILDITNFQNIANIAGDSTERYFYKDDRFSRMCQKYRFHLLVGSWLEHYDYLDGKEYKVEVLWYPGSVDDAATYGNVTRKPVVQETENTNNEKKGFFRRLFNSIFS